MKWLTRIFGGKAASNPGHQTPEQRDEHALALYARQRLMPFSKGLKGGDELFMPAEGFLTSLKERTAQSAALCLTQRPETMQAAARITMQGRILKGEMPILFHERPTKTIFMNDIYVRPRDVADHAAKLLALGQVYLACAYADALEDRIEDMEPFKILSQNSYFTYSDGSDIAQYFEMGADVGDQERLQPVIRRKYGGAQPG
ncbi:MAG TPA: hypothetical protein VGD95_00785 [Micavibrio sp.]